MNLERDGEKIVRNIKTASWFPYKNGKLRDEATSGQLIDPNTYCITFSTEVAPYVEYLEEGTQPHDIFNAFGFALGNNPWKKIVRKDFGIGGNFDGKFHPGSTKHKGFISEKSTKAVCDYFVNHYGGILK